MNKLILGIVASLIVAGISGAVAQSLKVESRVARLEENKERIFDSLKDHRDEQREIRSDVKELLRQQAETNATLRELAAKGQRK